MQSRTTQRILIVVVLAALVIGGVVAALALSGDDSDDSDNAAVDGTTQTDGDPGGGEADKVSAAEGAAARARQAAALAEAKAEVVAGRDGSETAASTADQALPVDCGIGGEPYAPTAEEILAANADTDGLAAMFDRFGVAYTRQTDDFGFAWLDYDYEDVIAESVAFSFWEQRYPAEPISEDELARMRAENDALAAAFDAAGVVYTRSSDESGWEWLEWDYDDPAAQEAADRVYSELYPPEPIPAEELEAIRAENDGLAAALDAAGIAYTRNVDESGWEWLEWDYDDPAAQTVVEEYYRALYPVEPCLEGDVLVDPVPGDDAVVSGPAPVDEIPAEELEAIRAENDGLAAALDAAGIAYERITDDAGYEYLEWDYEDDAAALVVERYYEELYAPDPAVVAARDATVAALVDALTQAGVTNQVRGESPYQSVIFDLDAEAAPAAVQAARG